MVQKVLKHNKRHMKSLTGPNRFDEDVDLSSSDDEINNNDEIDDSDVENDAQLTTIVKTNNSVEIKVNS